MVFCVWLCLLCEKNGGFDFAVCPRRTSACAFGPAPATLSQQDLPQDCPRPGRDPKKQCFWTTLCKSVIFSQIRGLSWDFLPKPKLGNKKKKWKQAFYATEMGGEGKVTDDYLGTPSVHPENHLELVFMFRVIQPWQFTCPSITSLPCRFARPTGSGRNIFKHQRHKCMDLNLMGNIW